MGISTTSMPSPSQPSAVRASPSSATTITGSNSAMARMMTAYASRAAPRWLRQNSMRRIVGQEITTRSCGSWSAGRRNPRSRGVGPPAGPSPSPMAPL